MDERNTNPIGTFFTFLAFLVIMYVFWAPIIFFIVVPICSIIYDTVIGAYRATGKFVSLFGIREHFVLSLLIAILPSGVSAWSIITDGISNDTRKKAASAPSWLWWITILLVVIFVMIGISIH